MYDFLTKPKTKKKKMKSIAKVNNHHHHWDETEAEESIEKLPDAMLLEILYRLPCCRRAVQFKSVSKRWLSVISNPYFICHFMDHHRHYVCKFTHVFQNTIELNVNTYIRLVSYDHNDNPSFKFDPRIGLEFLDFLPVLSLHYPVCIQASFNDLLLVCTQVPKASFFEYYICNPFTKHWLKLPPIPTDGTRTRVMIGFLCDPYICDSDREQGCITNAHYRFMVVRILCPEENTTQIQTQLQVQIFSSETNEWRNSVVSSPRKLNLNPFMPIACYAGVIACNGMLHWVCVKVKEIKGFVVFDPFNDSEQCHYIHPPIDLSLRHYVSLGVFRRRLRIFQLISYFPHNFYAGSFSLWELEDYSNAGTWCMKQKVYFSNMVFKDFLESAKNIYGPDYADERAKMMLYRDMTFLAFHPYDGDSVFLNCGDSVQLCNLRMGVLKRVYYSVERENSRLGS